MGDMGPGGILEVSGRAEETLVAPLGIASLLVPAHGDAVEPIGGTACVPAPGLAQGAWVPAPDIDRVAATEGWPESGAVGRA